MENQIISNERYAEAYRLHNHIMASGNTAAEALVELCRSLKKMRDDKLYADLGQNSFDEYCVQMVGIKARQAYTYISTYEKYGDSVLQLNANLGITKLSLISQLPPSERQELLEHSEDTAAMSTAEIKALVDKTRRQGEQLDLLVNEKRSAESELEELKEKNEHLQAQIRELEMNDPAPEVDEDALRAEIEADLRNQLLADAEAKAKAKSEKAIATAKKEFEKQMNSAIADAESKAKTEAEKNNSQLTARVEELCKNNEQLKKQLKVADTKQTTVLIYFNQFKADFEKLLSAVGELDESDEKKYRAAIGQALDKFKTTL